MKIDLRKLKKLLSPIEFIDFVIIFGSSKNGIINEGSDVDLALYFPDNIKIDFDKISLILKILEENFNMVKFDICILNSAGDVLKMEALKGKLLFAKSMERYASFYSLTVREFEDFMYWCDVQLKYRREAL